MTKAQVKEILNRVRTWPRERQEDVAELVRLLEGQDRSGLLLTDEQVVEVRRRRREEHPSMMTLAEFNDRLRRRYGI